MKTKLMILALLFLSRPVFADLPWQPEFVDTTEVSTVDFGKKNQYNIPEGMILINKGGWTHDHRTLVVVTDVRPELSSSTDAQVTRTVTELINTMAIDVAVSYDEKSEVLTAEVTSQLSMDPAPRKTKSCFHREGQTFKALKQCP